MVEYTKELARSIIPPRYPSQLHNLLLSVMEKTEVSDEIKQQWLKNRLTRLCHRNPQLLPYYIQIVSNPGVLRKLYSLIEVESLENGDSK